MSELTARAHDTPTATVAYDGAVGDVKEDDIEALKIEALKIEEPPPTEAAPIDSIVGAGNNPREMALDCKIVGLKHKVKTLTKENRDLKREIMKLKHDAIVLRKSMAPWLPKLEDLPEKAREKWGNEEITTATLSSTTVRGRTYRFVLANGKHTVDKEYILRTETGDSGHYFLRKNDVDEWHFISRKVRDKQAPLEDKAALDALRASNEDDGT